MYFFEQKAILPITDDILRQTGGIESLRERVWNADGVYLSSDGIVVPIFSEYRLAHHYGNSDKRKEYATIRDLGNKKRKILRYFLNHLKLNIILMT